MSTAHQVVVCAGIVPDPLQALEPVASRDGASQVSFTNGFAPQSGDIFNMLSCASRSGAFAE